MIEYFKFIVIGVILLLSLKACQKDEPNVQIVDVNLQDIDTLKVENRSGITLAPIFFATSGTTTNSPISKDLVYTSYNYSYIDSITFNKTSSSHATIYYSNNDKMVAANFDIVLHKNNGDTIYLKDYLSEYKLKNKFTYYPSNTTDLFHSSNKDSILVFKKLKQAKKVIYPYTKYVGDINIWEVSLDNKVIIKDYLFPERVTDYTFVLNNKP